MRLFFLIITHMTKVKLSLKVMKMKSLNILGDKKKNLYDARNEALIECSGEIITF